MPPATHREWKLNGRQSFDCLKLNKDIPTPSPQGSEVLIQGKSLPTCAGILRTNAYSQGSIAKLPRRCDRIREIPSTLQALYGSFIVRGIAIGSRVQFEEMNRAIEANNIQPFVDKVFKSEDAVDAYKHLEGQSFTGKVVIEMD